ncbi:TetR/AcrR family transcriptional regulator [Cellulomonas fimi]|uniref:Regulatory protein TetR n=1 Tax=Cellulomonas fimi (strain ATCC 484 / DSM 20113 / JCM 1341 / CCUG 24087 / LMG 16345 / NBRC 15513 / NCIMB 8980 / NCTC 7547 / NRS-133) TaxID=590998 RepID=F4H0T5_CELFA|nr:regulatory protein TetR [Cellulomonas fimi ATCC 484]NNH07029.1 TetR/AcrR family transcriptional regulator [Cellulomonas fimi]VEH31962.1 HTH-type transcriptional regulator RutR [Cellulomonas fimi]
MSDAQPPTSLDPRVVRSRDRVLAGTVELVIERGIAGTTIEAVSERTGVARTTIYRHWPSQSALVLAAFGSVLQVPSAPDSGSLRDDLLVLVEGLAAALAGPAARLMPALIDAAERDPRFAALHREEATTRHAPVLLVIRRGIARGELPPETDPVDVLDLVTGPLFYRRWVGAGRVDADYVRTVVDTVLTAYGTPRPS